MLDIPRPCKKEVIKYKRIFFVCAKHRKFVFPWNFVDDFFLTCYASRTMKEKLQDMNWGGKEDTRFTLCAI